MQIKKLLAGWSKICPGCNIGRKYPDSPIGKKAAFRMTLTLRYTAAMNLRRRRIGNNPMISDFFGALSG